MLISGELVNLKPFQWSLAPVQAGRTGQDRQICMRHKPI